MFRFLDVSRLARNPDLYFEIVSSLVTDFLVVSYRLGGNGSLSSREIHIGHLCPLSMGSYNKALYSYWFGIVIYCKLYPLMQGSNCLNSEKRSNPVNIKIVTNRRNTIWVKTILILSSVILGSGSFVFGHGGKTHAESFTALQALQKATELYDRLIVNGKLDASWETDLQRAEVTFRRTNNQKEYRVGFHRQVGNPAAVYIFFSSEGKYSGSNFDGQW